MIWLLLLSALYAEPVDYGKYIVATNRYECLLIRDPEGQAELPELLDHAFRKGFQSIRIQGGEWNASTTVVISNNSARIRIQGEPGDPPAIVRSKARPAISLRQVREVVIENLTLEGGIELDETEDVEIRTVTFVRSGILLKGKRCNQPNECTAFNNRLTVEECLFRDCERGIKAESLENSVIRKNRFTGALPVVSCDRPIGIELNGSLEDLDRLFEYGHNKANQIYDNSFEQRNATGIKVKHSLGNTIRENRFAESFRAMEFEEKAKFNQALFNYIAYLSQESASAACNSPCGVYLGPGSVNNIFINNLFEQNFEIQFLDRHRNTTLLIDESGNRNVFRSDFIRIIP